MHVSFVAACTEHDTLSTPNGRHFVEIMAEGFAQPLYQSNECDIFFWFFIYRKYQNGWFVLRSLANGKRQ